MTESTYCSKRLGEISHEKFQTALSRMGLGHLKSVLPITEGNFGQNAFLVTDRGEFVFRGCPHSPWQFAKERRFAELLHEKTEAPVPWPYLLDRDVSLFGWPYVIMPRMQGEHISDELCGDGISKEDQIGISEAMGRALAGLQHLRNDFCGEYDAVRDEFRPFECSHAEYVRRRLFKGLEEAGSTISSGDRKWAEEQFHKAQPLLGDNFTPQFVMQDYKPGNVVVRKDAHEWVVSGVFDFMEPFFADGEMDLCRTLCCCIDAGSYNAAVAFIAGYVSGTKLRPGYLERFPVYLMLDRLIIWNFAWRHGQPWWNKSLSFREWLNMDTLMQAFHQGVETAA